MPTRYNGCMLVYSMTCSEHPEAGVRYIGITVNLARRISQHKWAARNGSTLPVHKWMRKHGADVVEFETLRTAESYNELRSLEIRLISEYRLQGCDLLNMTDGGDGATGYKHTDQYKIDASRPRPELAGQNNPSARLAEYQVLEIVNNLQLNNYELGRRYGVSHATIQRIRNGSTWKHVARPDVLPDRIDPRYKLNQLQVTEIRSRLNDGEKGIHLAEEFGVTTAQISSIRNRKTWR